MNETDISNPTEGCGTRYDLSKEYTRPNVNSMELKRLGFTIRKKYYSTDPETNTILDAWNLINTHSLKGYSMNMHQDMSNHTSALHFNYSCHHDEDTPNAKLLLLLLLLVLLLSGGIMFPTWWAQPPLDNPKPSGNQTLKLQNFCISIHDIPII